MTDTTLKKGSRVKSLSDGFTQGLIGTVESFAYGGDPPERAAFINFDEGGCFAVAVRLLEELPQS